MSPALRANGDALLTGAPLVLPVTVDLDAAPEAVWAALAGDRMWSWTPAIDRLRWATPPGPGAIRYLRLARLTTLEEEFYRWDEANLRATFHVTRASRALMRGLAEDFKVEPRGAGSRLTWTMALDAPGVSQRLAPVMAPGNKAMIGGIRKIL